MKAVLLTLGLLAGCAVAQEAPVQINQQCLTFARLVLIGQQAADDTEEEFHEKLMRFERLYSGPSPRRALAVMALVRGYNTPSEADQTIIAQKAYDDCIALIGDTK